MTYNIRLLNVKALSLGDWHEDGDIVQMNTEPNGFGYYMFTDGLGYLYKREVEERKYWEFAKRPTVGGI